MNEAGLVYDTEIGENRRRRSIKETTGLLISPPKVNGHKHFTTALRRDTEHFDTFLPDKKLTILAGMSTKTNREIDVLSPIIVIGRKLLVAKVVTTASQRQRQLSRN